MGLFRLNEADNVRGVTPGVSTSPFMKQKSAMGYNNSPDIGNIIPDAEYDAAYDNSYTVGYTSSNAEVLEELSEEFPKEAYVPRANYEKDEVFKHNEVLKKKLSDLWIKVKNQ